MSSMVIVRGTCNFIKPIAYPAMVAVMKLASVPANIARSPSRARSCRRLHDPSRVQRDAPAVALQGGPFERPGHRHGQCGPIGSAQDAAVGVETAPLSGTGEIAKKHGTGPRNDYAAGGVAGARPARARSPVRTTTSR